MKIVINGIGVAGPALGYWLTKAGHEVLLVEEAPRLRAGGYIIDFWGIGYDIVEEMGLIGEIRRLGYQVREVRFVGRDGRKRGGFDRLRLRPHDPRSVYERTPVRCIGDDIPGH